jgi:hypothetical protein
MPPQNMLGDNLQSYMRLLFEEKWDCYSKDPNDIAWLREKLIDADKLREGCVNWMCCGPSHLDEVLVDAIGNSVNWEELRLELLEKVVN